MPATQKLEEGEKRRRREKGLSIIRTERFSHEGMNRIF